MTDWRDLEAERVASDIGVFRPNWLCEPGCSDDNRPQGGTMINAADLADLTGHSFGSSCPQCPGERGTPGQCDHVRYSRGFVRFLKAHFEEYRAAYLNPDKRSSAATMERLAREFVTVQSLRGHDCVCPGRDLSNPHKQYGCPRQDLNRGYPACSQCKILHAAEVKQDVAVEIGRTGAVHPPTPMVTLLDAAAGWLNAA